MNLPGKLTLRAFYPRHIDLEAPDIEDVMSLLREKKMGLDILGGISLTYVHREGNEIFDNSDIHFVTNPERGVMLIYNWQSPSTPRSSETTIEIDDGGGNEISISERFFHQPKELENWIKEFLQSARIEDTNDWVSISGFSKQWL